MMGHESLTFLLRAPPGWPALALFLGVLLVAVFLAARIGRGRAEAWLARRSALGSLDSLLARCSARLIPASLADIDAEISAGLAQVATLFRMDRATLRECVTGTPRCISWSAVGNGGAAPVPEGDRFPWTAARLQRGESVRFARLDDLPAPEAERASYRAEATRSYLALPLSAGGAMVGVLAFDTVYRERGLSSALATRLLLLGEVFAAALERKRLELLLAERLQFETLLSQQSAIFSGLSAREIDDEIPRALRRIADFFKADSGSLAEVADDTRVARITYSWVAEGVVPRPALVALADVPWVIGRLRAGEVVRFSRIEDLPADSAAVDREAYRKLGLTSRVEAPLKVGGSLLGALAFSTLGTERAWPDQFVQRLRLLGEVFGSVLSRRKSEMEAQRLRRDLGHVGRVSTLGELTVTLAHQLNQPLAAILSNAQTAQDVLDASEVNLDELREILADIVEDDKRAGEVIRRLRGLLKNGEPDFTVLDIDDVVGEVARLVGGDFVQRSVAIQLDLAGGLPSVWGDRVQLQQVVLNLVLNGLDAIRTSPAGTRTLLVSTSVWSGAGDGRIGVRVEVRDSGTGIDEADLDHVFEAFYTTKIGGLGMGLTIARSIVEAHGGCLSARNEPRGGATLSFTLPATDRWP